MTPTGIDDATDDKALMAAHVAGDPHAFEELVRRHRDRLWAVAIRTIGDREDAADAVQDGLISAYRNAASYRGDAAVTTWLHRIVVNACLDLARRKSARPAVPLEDHQEPASTVTAADEVGDRETSVAVVAALRQLPIEQSAALVLVDIEGFAVAEAAEMLDVPIGTIKSRCARGRARLAELLTDGNATARQPVQTTDQQIPPPGSTTLDNGGLS